MIAFGIELFAFVTVLRCNASFSDKKDHGPRTTDHEDRPQTKNNKQQTTKIHPWWYNFKYMPVGILFGIVFVKAENHILVSYSGNVPFAKFSYVRSNWHRSGSRHYIRMAH